MTVRTPARHCCVCQRSYGVLKSHEGVPMSQERARMRSSWKKWRLALIATLTALALSVAFAGPAAAAEPGEWGSWNQETVNNHYMQVASQGTLSEARNAGNLLEVWRGATNDQVWMSFNNGNAFTVGG